MTASVLEVLQEALRHQQEGRLEPAEALYHEVLAADPDNPDAWHLLAAISLQRNEPDRAAALALQAIRRRPEIAAFHNTLGEALAARGQKHDAVRCYREALRLESAFVPALVNLGNALQADRRFEDAAIAYWHAIQARPGCVEAFSNLGNALRALRRLDEALDCYREALRLDPGCAEAAVNLAAALLQLRRNTEAEQWARRALELRPGLVEAINNLSLALLNQERFEESELLAREAIRKSPAAAHLHCNLGSVLLQQKKFAAAETACRCALDLQPEYAEAASNLGAILRFQDRLEEAADYLTAAIRWQPHYAEAWTNLGSVRESQGRPAEAFDCFTEAVKQNPDHVKSHFCRGLALLSAGRLTEGFAEYEWRWKLVSPPPRAWQKPEWDGSPLEGRTILLFAEQGLGDTIQFARYAPLVAARGGRVVIEAQPGVARVVGSIAGVDGVITPEMELPEFDVRAALLSLPRIMGISPETIPGKTPYLAAEQSRIECWREALGPAGSLRVGVAWRGNPQHASDRHRSIPLEALGPLADIPGVEWHSLHNGEKARAEVEETGGWLRQWPLDSPDELAAFLCSMDLVISADTMPLHLAGALGLPVWALISFAPDWRWQLDRDDTPWYPGMRLFRQTAPGAWRAMAEEIAQEISVWRSRTREGGR